MCETRICSKCGETKPTEAFYTDKTKKSGYRPDCKACHRSYQNRPEAQARRNEARRGTDGPKDYMLKYTYGITRNEWHFIFAEQGNRCAICRDTSPGHKRGWMVDHDHESGKVRSIVCHHCNSTLGQSKESPARLLACAAYVHKHHPERATATYE